MSYMWTRCVDGMPTSEITRSLSRTSTHPTLVTRTSRSWSWMINSHPFCSMLIDPPIPKIRLFQTLTLKLQGQGHGYGQSVRSHIVCPASNWFASFSFYINQTNNFWETAISTFDLENCKVKVMGEVKVQGHIVDPASNWCTSFSFHVNWTNHSYDSQ